MWFFVVLCLLCILAAPVAFFLALAARSRASRLQGRVDRLEAEVKGLHGLVHDLAVDHPRRVQDPQPHASPGLVEAPAHLPTTPPPPPPTPPPPSPPRDAAPPRRSRDLESILGGQWLTWLGVLALFFGSAFFLGVDLGYSPLSGWPQILIGLLVAAAFNTIGRFCSERRERILGLGLLGGGIALLFLVAYAAYGFHDLIPVWLVFPLLLVVATVGAILALDRNALSIAVLTLIGAFLTPGLLRSESDTTLTLLPYLVAVNLGAVIAGRRDGWGALMLGAFMATLVMVAGWWSSHGHGDQSAAAFLGVTGSWLVFAAAPWLYRVNTRYWSLARGGVLAGNGLAYALFCHAFTATGGERSQGAVLLVLAATYVVLSRWLTRRQGSDPATRLTHLTGVALAAVAVPVMLNLAWVTLGWLALAVILLVAGLRERDPWHRVAGLAVLALVLVRSLFVDMPRSSAAGYHPVFNGEFLAGLVVTGVLAWLAWTYHRREEILTARERRLRAPLLVAAAIVGVWKLTVELLGFFDWRSDLLGIGQTERSLYWVALLWAVYGAAACLAGVRWRRVALRVAGDLLLVGAVVLTAGLGLGRGHQLDGAYTLLLNLPWLQGLVVTALLLALYGHFNRRGDGAVPPAAYLGVPVLFAAVLLLFVNLSGEVVTYFRRLAEHDGSRRGVDGLLALTLVWILYAAVVVVWGFVWRHKQLRVLGILLLVLTVAKVFAVDMQELDRGYRIVAFVAVGVLLLAISVLYQRERRSRQP